MQLVVELPAKDVGDELRDLEIVDLGLAAHVVRLANLAALQHEEHGGGDVAGVDVEARARARRSLVRVYGDLLAVDDLVDAERDELLRVLPLAESVHHIHRDDRQPVRVEVRVADHLGRRLRGRVGVGGAVGVVFLEVLAVLGRAEDLVGREVDERLELRQPACVLEEVEGRPDVVHHEGHRVRDRVVHVRLRGEVQYDLDVLANLVDQPRGDG
mmetsp:Transcript_10646/g.23137  ORF Transcript_10646/g.23137 Transcript_10646/m.23137 type:complete len:214 (-) Transcript_10646:1495-2136(-)